MKKNLFVLVAALFVIQLVSADDLKVKVYKPSSAETELLAALDTATVYSYRLDVAKSFREKNPTDIAVQIRTSDVLAVDDPDEVRGYYKNRLTDNPKNIADLYMAGRYAQEVTDRRDYAEKIFALNSDDYWGHLLMATAFDAEADSDFAKAEGELRKAIAVDNSKPFALEMLGGLLGGAGRTDDAEQVFIKLADMLPNEFFPVQSRMVLYRGNFTRQKELIDEYLKRQPADAVALDLRARVCREQGDWSGYISSMQRAVAAEPIGVNFYNLACGFSLNNQPDSAFANLALAMQDGMNDADQYNDDTDLIPLHQDPRWPDLLEAVEAEHKNEVRKQAIEQAKALEPAQQQRVVQRNADAQAPDFTLMAMDGSTIALADLKGKVVILDFWATWCGPCRRTMPLLDGFYKDHRDPNVLVYGVNVWERDGNTSGVKPFIEKAGYQFPILYGSNDLATEYGVSGIPTLFVIDKQGKIAYRHVGYNPQIVQMLTAQTQELLK